MFNEHGFYIMIGDFSHFVFYRTLANYFLIIVCVVIAIALYQYWQNNKRLLNRESKVYDNNSSIEYVSNSKGVIVFPDSSRYVGKIKENLPHGKGTFIRMNNDSKSHKYNYGQSPEMAISKLEEGYIYAIKEKSAGGSVTEFLYTLSKRMMVISIVILVIAIIPKMPYGFYIIVRFVVCATGIIVAYIAYCKRRTSILILSSLMAIVYNPLVPLHLGRELWVVVNLLTIVLIIVLFFSIRKMRND